MVATTTLASVSWMERSCCWPMTVRSSENAMSSATLTGASAGCGWTTSTVRGVKPERTTVTLFMLRDEKDYHDLGGRYLADRDKQRVTQNLLRRLRNLGVEVEVKAA